MDIAFYAPLKSPSHPVPSGDRLMARQLIAALELAGHSVTVVSEFRSFLPAADSPVGERDGKATEEAERISTGWEGAGKPDMWICYHPYYKAPDLIGIALCRRFAIPYVTVETSYSSRRNLGQWAQAQDLVLEGARMAAASICLTERDLQGLEPYIPKDRLFRLAPFIQADPYLTRRPAPQPGRLITVAMMRSGDKLSSYAALAAALHEIADLPWTLSVIGDGPARTEVERLFGAEIAGRVEWLGQKNQDEIAALLSTASIYVWPGHGEAYGLAYLEAQAAGLPVVAESVAGVPEAVANGRSGLLTPPGDQYAYAQAIALLLKDAQERQRLARGARAFVAAERDISAASARLDQIITSCRKDRS
ncbi:glycosyltransferase [Rhizobium deserti]|uniref:Glycosyltransferase n=1 Tax=Rhizobium deserti TaxID=2547961 RepID=A0A4R5UKF8_9HYPH|nr:glycosyltransferase family 4 protein [Rhizobium deserti]TDK37387.1 glycosyltransferase [Rhizobium deserti]